MGIVDNLMTHPASITRKARTGSLDAHGVPLIEDIAGMTTVCYLSQGGQVGSQRSEVTAGREAEEESFVAFFPADVQVDGTDTVTIDGVSYEVIGPSWFARDPLTDTVDHAEANLRVVTG